jgi:cob(I)alamin adenosyltransferase
VDKPRREAQSSSRWASPRSRGGSAIARIYTRTGDKGETSLFSGERAPKDDPRFEALGDIDELVASLGVAKVEAADAELKASLTRIQSELYLLMAELASSGAEGGRKPALALPADAVAKLEGAIDALDAGLPALRDFVMPGESRASASLHAARTVCRRAERRVVAAGRGAPVSAAAVIYLNRLSDLLFVMARAADHHAGQGDRTFKSEL